MLSAGLLRSPARRRKRRTKPGWRKPGNTASEMPGRRSILASCLDPQRYSPMSTFTRTLMGRGQRGPPNTEHTHAHKWRFLERMMKTHTATHGT